MLCNAVFTSAVNKNCPVLQSPGNRPAGRRGRAQLGLGMARAGAHQLPQELPVDAASPCTDLPSRIREGFILITFGPYWIFTAVWAFSLVVASGGYSLVAVHGLFIAVTSLAVEHGL